MFSTKATSLTSSAVVASNEPQRPNEGDVKRVWYLDQIYDPDVHAVSDMSKYIIPYEGEIVIDATNNRLLEVTHVDKNATWKSTMTYFYLTPEKDTSDYDLYPQQEYGFLQGELALSIDFTVRPPVARVDSNCVAPDAAYALLYKGSLIGTTGTIISASYSGQDLIDNHIGVTPVVYDNYENKTVMGCNSFSVQQNETALPNGTRCTLVFYDQAGYVIPPTYSVAVQQSGYMRDHQLSKKYVKSIELLSPWFTNSTRPKTMFLAINLVLSSVEFKAKIHYSDGSYEEHPVNSYNGDSGFTIHGIDQYKPTTPGQVSDAIVLTYTFKESEQAMIAQAGSPDHMSEVYEIVATPSEGAYSPRTYSYPYWDSSTGWKLKHFLTDLDRKYCWDVTDKVTLNDASPVFQGKTYGSEQNLIFNLNLRDVSASYEPWAMTQEGTITLYNPGTTDGRKWDVRHSYSKPAFSSLEIEYWDIDGGIKSRFADITSTDNFIELGYTAFEPIYDPRTEVGPLTPTHFDIVRVSGESRTAIPIAQWNDIPISDMSLTTGESFFIRWTQRDQTGNELQLGVSGGSFNKITNPNN